MKIVEGSEDKYQEGTPEYEAWGEGREAYMAYGSVDDAAAESPYQHQPHHAKLHKAFVDGAKDEEIWKLDTTGR